jgi:prolyl-tRNA synthetase
VRDAFIVVDESVRDTPNLVAGANKVGYHLRNVNLGRDYQADVVADIANAWEEAPCPQCGAPMRSARAIEIGNIFKLGTRYSEILGATYLDAEGQSHPIVMGSYGIGSGRAAASIAEQCFDEKGLIWPVAVAPFSVALLNLGKIDDADTTAAAERLDAELAAAGIDVLYDDRDERAGVKFNDADLIGIPLRLSVSPRTLKQGTAEMKGRKESEAVFIPLSDVVSAVREKLRRLA